MVPLYIEQVEATYRGKDPHYAERKATDLMEYVVRRPDLKVQPAGHRWNNAADITADAWKEAMPQLHHKRGGPLRWRSINHVALTLRAFLRWCSDKGIILQVPELEGPTTDEQRMDAMERRALTEDEMESFLWALALQGEARALRIYTVLFERWQRKSTIEALTLRWVDFRRETINIPAKHFKTKREKLLDLTPRCAEAIREELSETQNIDPDRPVFGRFSFHQAWSEEKRGGVFGRALALAGIDRHALAAHHVTRHTAATLALENGVSILGAMAQGGWDSMQSMERYTHANLKHAGAAARARALVAR